MQCELALLQEAIAHSQQEEDSLQAALAKVKQCLTQKQHKSTELETHITKLSLSNQEEEQLKLVCTCVHKMCSSTGFRP